MNGIISNEQNGFQKNRSTIDLVSSLTSIIETRKMKKLPTFCAFIDFSKANDFTNRGKLQRIIETGITSKMFSAIKSLYSTVLTILCKS